MTTMVGGQDPDRSMRSLLVTTVLLPLLLVALGVWEWQRAGPAEAALVARKVQVERAVAALEARPISTNAMPDFDAQFARDGQLYGGELALAQAREERDALDRDIVLARVRRVLPPVTMACAGFTPRFPRSRWAQRSCWLVPRVARARRSFAGSMRFAARSRR